MKTLSPHDSLRVGLFYPNGNVHFGSRLSKDLNPNIDNIDEHKALASAAEAAGFDYLFMADSWLPYGPEGNDIGWHDAYLFSPILGAALAGATSRIGIITTIHSSLFHPVQIARMGASLDVLSGGRWGFNVVTGVSAAAGLIENSLVHTDHDSRYDAANETMEILHGLWSGEALDYNGKFYQVKGQVIGPRPVQRPMPLIVSAGASDTGRAFAAKYSDFIFMPGMTPPDILSSAMDDIGRRAASRGRNVRLQVHVSTLVRETQSDAARVSAMLKESVHLPAVAEYLRYISGLSTTYEEIYEKYTENDLRQVGMVSGALQAHGGPDEVAEQMIRLYHDNGVRGVALTFPLWHAAEIRRFADLVLPRLAEAGIWTHPEERGWNW